MTAGSRAWSGAALALALAAADANAQSVGSALRQRPSVDVGVALGRVAAQTRSELAPRDAAAAGRWSRWRLSTPANVLGGALVGASLGYFVSQVVMSDWEGSRAADRLPYRRRLALSGAALGAVGGYLLRPRGRARRAPRAPTDYLYIARSDRHYIAASELRRSVVLNALDAVQQLRPEWLRGGARGGAAPGRDVAGVGADSVEIAVYVVDTRVGGLRALEDVAIPEVEELRLYEPDDAERRWGRAHPRGAIEVVPVAPR